MSAPVGSSVVPRSWESFAGTQANRGSAVSVDGGKDAKCDRDGVPAGCNACDRDMTWSVRDPISNTRGQRGSGVLLDALTVPVAVPSKRSDSGLLEPF